MESLGRIFDLIDRRGVVYRIQNLPQSQKEICPMSLIIVLSLSNKWTRLFDFGFDGSSTSCIMPLLHRCIAVITSAAGKAQKPEPWQRKGFRTCKDTGARHRFLQRQHSQSIAGCLDISDPFAESNLSHQATGSRPEMNEPRLPRAMKKK